MRKSRQMKAALLLVAVTFGSLAVFDYNSNRSDTKASKVSDQPIVTAPEFDLVDVSGGRMKSVDIKGKVAVIDIWATWCAPCILEIPNFNELHAEYETNGVQMLGITVESGTVDEIKPKVAQFEMKYPVLLGDEKVVEGFGGQIGFPTTYVVTQDWKIYKKYLGMKPNKKQLIEEDIKALLRSSG